MSHLTAPPQEAVAVWDLTSLKAQAGESVETRSRAWDILQAAAALQGLANRDRPRLYLNFVGDGAAIDRYWYRRLRSSWLKGDSEAPISSLEDALVRFRRFVRGVVVWDPMVPATSNVASTVAGVENLLPVRFDMADGSLYRRLIVDPKGPHLQVKVRLVRESGRSLFLGSGLVPGTNLLSSGSPKCDAYVWAVEKYLKTGKCFSEFMAYYPDATWLTNPHGVPLERSLLTNHDFFVAKRSFFFDLSPWDDEAPDDDLRQPLGADLSTLKLILGTCYRLNHGGFVHIGGFTPWDQKYTDFTGRKHGGVPTEWRYAEILSCYNAFMDADAPGLHAMANASVFMHEPLKTKYPQPNLPRGDGLVSKGYQSSEGRVESKSFVAIYVGDYDSAAWLYTMMPQIWDDPKRGSIPLGWAFNPSIDARFPTGLVYARQTSSPNDTFLSGDSGAGYLNPGYLTGYRKWSGLPSGLDAWKSFNAREFKRWDLGIVGFVIDGNAPAMDDQVKSAYAEFSPAGVVAQKVPPISFVNGTPFLRMGSDLPHDSIETAAQIVCRDAPNRLPAFSIFRTILWKPSEIAALMARVKNIRPEIEFVEPYTLMALARTSNRPDIHR